MIPALTSTQTASLLDVHPSTVKRWCNDGELGSGLTPGGHRRIEIDDAVAFARDRGIRTILSPFHPFERHVWTALRELEADGNFAALHSLALGWAGRGHFDRLEQLFHTIGRESALPFGDFCDGAVRGLMQSVGDEWQNGRLRVGDEHMISQAMAGALLSLRRAWHDTGVVTPRAGAVAVVGAMEGNLHGLGSLCVRLLLEHLGWEVFYPGADVPAEDFAKIQLGREASLVCISLPPSGSAGDASRVLSILRRFYDRGRPYSVAFGGSASASLHDHVSASPFRSVSVLDGCRELHAALDAGLGSPEVLS